MPPYRPDPRIRAFVGMLATLIVTILAVGALLLLSGCVSSNGATWWNPTTWASGSAAKASEKAEKKAEVAADNAVKQAQRAAHETQEALASAPVSRPVELAIESNDAAVSLLDQSQGPLTLDERDAIKREIAGLLSENVGLREAGEKARREAREAWATASAKLDEADKNVERLRGAAAAEAAKNLALANAYRNEQLQKYASLAGSAILGLLAVAWKLNLGRVQAGLANVLAHVESKHGAEAKGAAAGVADAILNAGDQTAVAKIYSKLK
jgi:ElaB/YqjD/DUF883 family membrane-anchored ribosome-binding protein